MLLALWDLGAGSAREIHAKVGAPGGRAYTTTATVLDRLHVKGLVSRERRGRAFIYRPRIKRAVVERARARQSVERLLGPGPEPPMAALVDAVESIDPKLLDDLARAVAARRKRRDGS